MITELLEPAWLRLALATLPSSKAPTYEHTLEHHTLWLHYTVHLAQLAPIRYPHRQASHILYNSLTSVHLP